MEGLFRLIDRGAPAISEGHFANHLLGGQLGGGVALVIIEDEFDLEFIIEAEAGIEGFVELGFEAGERTDKLFGDELASFFIR